MPKPRIAPLQPPYQPETAAMLAKWMPPGAAIEPLVLFRTLAVHSELFARMRPLGAGILGHPRLDPRDREIPHPAHLRASRRGVRVGSACRTFGRPLGLTEQQIAATAAGQADDPAWSAADAHLAAAADALYDTDTIPDRLWEALAARLRDDQLIEAVIVVGWYRLLSCVINATRIEPEPWAARFPRGAHNKVRLPV